MKNARSFIFVLLIWGLLFAVPEGGPVNLIKISKDGGTVWTVIRQFRVDIRQELESCYLALTDQKLMESLQQNGARLEVLDKGAEYKEYVIVPLSSPDSLSALLGKGKAIPVDTGTAVFWMEKGRSIEALPADLPRKPIASSSLLPYLRPPRSWIRRLSSLYHEAEPLIESLADKISQHALTSLVQSLQNYQTRFASTPNCEAAGQFIFNVFSTLGLDDVRFETFSFGENRASRNVIAQKTGESFPEDILIICAHYDSISSEATRETLAPGADDNASGAASVLETARILAPIPLDFTVRFIAFSAEEWGSNGSRAYAARARAADERIIGVINLDMVAYADTAPEDLKIFVNGPSEWMGDRFAAAASGYGELIAKKIYNPSMVYSDHASFWDQGYPALLAIEDSVNPYYHTTEDTLDKLNIDFFWKSSRASLGLLAELAQPLKTGYPMAPVGLTAKPGLYTSLFLSLKNVHLTWNAQADAAGYNIYRTNDSHLRYIKINHSPLETTTFIDSNLRTDIPYYYIVTAVGRSGLESNPSQEAEVTDDRAATIVASPSFSFLGTTEEP